ncbi:MAG: ComF family protein, partial [Solirubrobacterales bacterium]
CSRLALPGPPDWATTWVPSSRRRLRERGVELTRLLAGPAAEPLLRRVVHGADQTSLDAAARRAAPVGAFAASAAAPPRVVLVDDVRTTGATLSVCARALRAGGCGRVVALTLARVR